jgi:hypothetical protein
MELKEFWLVAAKEPKETKKLGNSHRSKNLFAHSLLEDKNIFWFPLMNPQDASF